MNKTKIFISHLVVFILGSAGIVVYAFNKLGSKAGVGGAVTMPVITVVYVIFFGILCSISLAVWLIIAHFRRVK